MGLSRKIVQTYRYWGVHLDIKLEWSINTDVVYKKGLRRLCFLRRICYINICNWIIKILYQSAFASAIFAVVGWDTDIEVKDANRLNQLIRKAGSIVGSRLATLEEVVEQRMPTNLLVIMENTSNPLHEHSTTVNIM